MTIEEKMNLISRVSKQEGIEIGSLIKMKQTVENLINKGAFRTEEEACEFLGYGLEEYHAALRCSDLH